MKKSTEVRSDHLLAIINYAYEQAATNDIDVLDFGDNEQDLDSDEQLEYLQDLLTAVRRLTFTGHSHLIISK